LRKRCGQTLDSKQSETEIWEKLYVTIPNVINTGKQRKIAEKSNKEHKEQVRKKKN
jgi:hypothetical protein